MERLSRYEHLAGRQSLLTRVRREIRFDDARPGAAHLAFARLPFRTVVTTNFDTLLELAYREAGRPCHVSSEEQLLSSEHHPDVTHVIKMHGDVEHPRSAVITEEDYDGFLTRSPVMATVVSSLLVDHTGVLIGDSMDDPDFRQLLRSVRDRLGRLGRYMWAIQVNATPATAYSFERRGIKVVSLSKAPGETHDDVLARFFTDLRKHLTDQQRRRAMMSDDDLTSALLRPESTRTICYMAVPRARLGLYRDLIYPTIRDKGLVLASDNDGRAAGLDISAWHEMVRPRVAAVVTESLEPSGILRSRDAGEERPPTLLISDGEKKHETMAPECVEVISRPDGEDYPDRAAFVDNVAHWAEKAQQHRRELTFEQLKLAWDDRDVVGAIFGAVGALERLTTNAGVDLRARIQDRRDEFGEADGVSRAELLLDLIGARDALLRSRDRQRPPEEQTDAQLKAAIYVLQHCGGRAGAGHTVDPTPKKVTWPQKRVEELRAILTGQDMAERWAVLVEAAKSDNSISRRRVYEIAKLPHERSLRGFARPIYTAISQILGIQPTSPEVRGAFEAYYDDPDSRSTLSHYYLGPDLGDAINELLEADGKDASNSEDVAPSATEHDASIAESPNDS